MILSQVQGKFVETRTVFGAMRKTSKLETRK